MEYSESKSEYPIDFDVQRFLMHIQDKHILAFSILKQKY